MKLMEKEWPQFGWIFQDMETRIDENDKVEFELEEGPKGMNAINVKKID